MKCALAMAAGLVAGLAAGIEAGPALALSCLPPDVARAFEQADAAEEVFIVVQGVLTFDATLLPVTDWENQRATPPHTRIPARLEGRALTGEGFTLPFSRKVTLDAQCYGPWCASAQSGTEFLVFLEHREGEYLFPLDPCGSLAFPDPTNEQAEQALQCLRGEGCEVGN